MKNESASLSRSRSSFRKRATRFGFLVLLGVWLLLLQPILGLRANGETGAFQWGGLLHLAGEMPEPLKTRSDWEDRDIHFYQSALSPGVLLRLKSDRVRFFGDLAQRGAEGPKFIIVKSSTGPKTLDVGGSISGSELQASWIVASFQGSKGWELFDTPWFLSLEKRPSRVTLTREGLQLEFPTPSTGYIFSMPFYGYYKPPQEGNDFAAQHGSPSKGIEPWAWRKRVPRDVLARAEWWASVSKAYPVGFQESFQVVPRTDEIVMRQDYRWLTIRDDWDTEPLRFATLSPTLGLAWKFPGFPLKTSTEIHDPDYFTAFGPIVGGINVDRIEIAMQVLQYTNELEQLTPPSSFNATQKEALGLIARGMSEKFPSASNYVYDHSGRRDLCWNIVGDVWYGRGLAFVDSDLKRRAAQSLQGYMKEDVLRPHMPHHGKYILRGPGIGSGGEWGDAGKFMANALQAIWAYAEHSGDWDLIRERWGLIQRYFVTPEEAHWTTYGRVAIAEMGDEAPPCSSYARMAWRVGDLDQYMFGAYMFARELVHHYVKQRGAPYFLAHQPYNEYEPMPAEVFPTHVSRSTLGWNVDGPAWGYERSPGHHQSTNRWVRFHDPDVGRFYRDHLKDDVRTELDWYMDAVRKNRAEVFRLEKFTQSLNRDAPHVFPSMVRLRSFLLGDDYESLRRVADMSDYRVRRASAIALGYSYLRAMVPVRHVRLVDQELDASPFVLGLQRRGLEDLLTAAQAVQMNGMNIEAGWRGWGFGNAELGANARTGEGRTFGTVAGNFNGKSAGIEGERWISYGTRVYWVDGVARRNLRNAESILRDQDRTPVAVIGPFPNESDSEITSISYPPEKETNANSSYSGLDGPISWQVVRFNRGRRIDLQSESPSSRGGLPGPVSYLLQHVWSEEEMEVYLLAGEQGGVQAWINDTRVISYHGRHRPRILPDAQQGLGKLKKGWNRLLVKTEHPAGRLIGQFRLVHLDRQPIPGLRFSAFPPG